MKILVSAASRHEATAEIGEAIAAELRASGADAEFLRAEDVVSIAPYDAVGVGVIMPGASAASTKGTGARPESGWIQCFGQTRAVTDGRLRCPVRGRATSIVACLACHHLEALGEERSVDPGCGYVDPGAVATAAVALRRRAPTFDEA